jgi:preprotein translocase subunit SecD
MIHIARWKVTLIVLISVLSFAYCVPNFLGQSQRDWLETNVPSWLPSKSVALGLDLKGGSHLLLEVDVADVIKQKSDDLISVVRPDLRKEQIGYSGIVAIPNGVRVTLTDTASVQKAANIIQQNDNRLVVADKGQGVIEAVFDERALKEITDQTINQSIEIVSRRVNETGTREPIIQRQGENRILVQIPGLENPERIKQLLGKTAKLTFHLVDLDGTSGADSRALPMRENPAQTIAIKRRAILTGDMLTTAQASFNQFGSPVVTFRLNAIGARKFCEVSTQNVNRPFAIVLDNEVISAPNLNEPICGGSAEISGNFTLQETADMAVLLRAGALPTSLTVVEERSVGPSLGSDSVEAGSLASILAFALVIGFMILNYGLFGVFASIALIINIAMIFALLSLLGAVLTLPGIAGIVLTMGAAVDANVLIFERMKEEIRAGRSIISAIDTGYEKAMSSIIDSNLTSLISAIILYGVGTGPIKGFAVTLSIGIITSLFSAVMVTRLMVVTWLRVTKPKTLPL